MNFQMPVMPQMPEMPDWSETNDIDIKLQALVAMAEKTMDENSFSVPLTLVTSGGLVSGQLVPQRAWAAEITALAEQSNSPGIASTIAAISSTFSDRHEFELEDDQFDRIHMVDVVLTFGVHTNEGVQWRGRLKDVVGWSFGKLAVSS